MDTLHLTTKPDSDTAGTKPGKTDRGGQPAGKVDSGEKQPTTSPAAKRDRKAAPVTKEVPVTGKDPEPTAEDRTVTTEVKVTPKDPGPAAEDPTVTSDAPVTAQDPEPTAREPSVSDSTREATASTVTEPKKPTKADLAKAIFDEMIKQPNVDRKDIIARFKKEANLTTSGGQSYYYMFQKKSGRVVAKGPTKMDQAREVFEALTNDGKARKEIIAALVKEVGLTKSGASTYYQTLKKNAAKPTE